MELRRFAVHRSVTLTTEMCALPYIVARLLWAELELSVLALLYVLRVDIEIGDLETMGDIDAMQHQDNRLASLESGLRAKNSKMNVFIVCI